MGKRHADGRHKATHKVDIQHLPSQKNSKSSALTIQPRPDWHATKPADVLLDISWNAVSPQLVEKLASHARNLLDFEASVYASQYIDSSTSHRFLSTIMKSGTWDDKVSALTLLVQESPLHMQKPFENLIGLASKRNRSTALMALGALKDLFGQGAVLPLDRKLRPFHKQPGVLLALQDAHHTWTPVQTLPSGIDKKHLIYWAFEDWVKRKYFEVIQILERWCNDEVEFARMRAITYVWELLKDKPEQEENLLRLLVNKLGDSNKKVASRASYLLLQLQTTHPSMITIIVEAIESGVLLRTNQSLSARYYAIITLNQTVLRIAEPQVANKLLDVYFGLFITILNASKVPPPPSTEHRQHIQGGRAPKKDIPKDTKDIEDKIVAQILTGVNRAVPFSTKDSDAYKNHMETLFRITHSANFNTSIQALLLIQQISSGNQLATDRFHRTLYDSLVDPRLARSSKQTMYLNLLYRSLKNDISLKRIKAFVKRLLQVLSMHEPPFVCASLYLIAELQKLFPSISALLVQPETLYDDTADSLEIKTNDQNQDTSLTEPNGRTGPNINRNDLSVARDHPYNGRKRDPEHSNAQNTCLWEILPWQSHFHPSVSLFASQVLASMPMPSEKPDPSFHTLIHFLDRFAYRNVKARVDGSRGPSIMQPTLARETDDALFIARDRGRLEPPLNTESFWKKNRTEVEVDQVFFHTYFRQRERRRAGDGATEIVQDATRESDNLDEGPEDQIWKALVGSRPNIEGSESSDLDVPESLVSVEEYEEGGAEINMDERGQNMTSYEDMPFPESDTDEDIFHESDESISVVDMPRPLKEEGVRLKRRRLKDLPTFAAAEDYVGMLDGEEFDS